MKTIRPLLTLLIILFYSIDVNAQNNALDFDASDDYVQIPDLSETTNGTIEMWILPDATGAENPVFGNGDDEALSLALRVTDDYRIQFSAKYGTNWVEVISDAAAISTTHWTHIAATWENAIEASVYVNGVLHSNPSFGTLTSATGNWDIGGSTISGAMDYFAGKIDEVRIWDDVRTTDEIRQNMFAELSDPGSEGNLVAYYKLNETNNATTAVDSKSTNNNGTLTGYGSQSGFWQTSPAFFGPKNCLDFDGSDEYVSLTNSALLKPENGLTLECWIKPDNWSSSQQQNFAGNTHNGGYNFALGYPSASHIGFAVHSGGNYQRVDADLTGYTGWHHVAGTFDGQYVRLYVDGEMKDEQDLGSSGNTITYDNDNCTILGEEAGEGCIPGGYNYAGMMDEVRFWDVARTYQQIQENMCKNLRGNESGLIAYYNFDNASEETLQDFSPNKIDGTLYNMENADWVSSSAYNTWLNTTSTDWSAASNWSMGSVPSASSPYDNVGIYTYGGSSTVPAIDDDNIFAENLVIGDDLEISNTTGTHVIHGSVFNIGNTTLKSNTDTEITGSLYFVFGSSLDIEPTASLSVDKNLKVDFLLSSGNLTIESDANGTGSLIIGGSSDGDVTIQRYIAGANWDDWQDGWHFLSSPVPDHAISGAFTVTPESDYDFYTWSEPDNLWVNFKDGTDPTFLEANGSNNFKLGYGYLVAYNDNQNMEFNGEINVDDVEITGLTISGRKDTYYSWHLLGNPFASALTWNSNWPRENIAGVAQIWNESGKSYSGLNSDAGAVIPSANGFMVQAVDGTGSLTIPASECTHSDQAFYKSTAYPYIILRAHNIDKPSFQETQIRFNPKSSINYDLEYDSDFLSGYAPLFYSKLQDRPMAVNSMPDLTESTSIPLIFIKNEGMNFKIEAFIIEEIGMDIWLYDQKLNIDHNLSDDPNYIFTSFEDDQPDRFLLHFSPLGTEEQKTNSINISIWTTNADINLYNPDQQKGTIKIFNMYGQQIMQTKLNGSKQQQINIEIPAAYYLVSVVTDKGLISSKIFVY